MAVSLLTFFLLVSFNLTDLNVIWDPKVVTGAQAKSSFSFCWKSGKNSQTLRERAEMIIFLLLFLHFFTLEPPRNTVLAAVVAEMGACRSQKWERGTPSSLFYETMVPREDFSLSHLLTLSLCPLATWPWMQTQSQWCTARLGTGQPKPQHSGQRTETEHLREMLNTGETEEKKFGIIIPWTCLWIAWIWF